ncbi:MAG: CubicO group peptidase (beta-lactamase class C family) [Paraglaciecola sp.]|jgi:CubicO group peptidase (beta-lactamase class C family)
MPLSSVNAEPNKLQRLVETEAVTSQTFFSLGSVCKSFTAIAIMQLMKKGVLKLDDPVFSHLSEFIGKPFSTITVHELLSHTSGLSELQGNQHQMVLSINKDALTRCVSDLLELTLAAEAATN